MPSAAPLDRLLVSRAAPRVGTPFFKLGSLLVITKQPIVRATENFLLKCDFARSERH